MKAVDLRHRHSVALQEPQGGAHELEALRQGHPDPVVARLDDDPLDLGVLRPVDGLVGVRRDADPGPAAV
eukprot:6476782-Lingulodinium_polyedra.AAC.1